MSGSDEGHPTSLKELGRRISVAIKLLGGRDLAAKAIEGSPSTLQKWSLGLNEPSFSAIAALSRASGVRLEWLATGEEPMRLGEPQPPSATSAVDAELLARLTDGISRVYKDLGSRISPADAVRIAAPEYEKILALTTDQAERLVMVKLAVENVRRELQASNDAASRKQQG